MKFQILVQLTLSGAIFADMARFDKYKVFTILPTTDVQLKYLKSLENGAFGFDFWKGPTYKNVSVEIMVPPHKNRDFEEILMKHNLKAALKIKDVQRLLNTHSSRTMVFQDMDWNEYYPLDEIHRWLEQLEVENSHIEIITGGKSYEGRDIKGVKISFNPGNKAVILEGGIHAREWVSITTLTYIINELLTCSDPRVMKLASTYDWYIFPVLNPDGYEYSYYHNRLWRKTRKPYGHCTGVDPNRNWGFHWGEKGTTDDPCSEVYAGPKAFSETETKTFAEFISKIQRNLVAYMSFHSYSQKLLVPYGHTSEHLDNYYELMDIGKKAIKTLSKRYGTKYKVGSISEVIYEASGSSMDWTKGVYKTPITYAFELRDKGNYGFILPKDLIIPTAEETFDAVITIMEEAREIGYI